MMYTPPQIQFTPTGEYVRLLVLRRLVRWPASVEELDEIVRRAVDALGVGYDWRIWPKLLEGEVEFRGGTAVITPRGEVDHRTDRR
jgi:hypothetical protein